MDPKRGPKRRPPAISSTVTARSQRSAASDIASTTLRSSGDCSASALAYDSASSSTISSASRSLYFVEYIFPPYTIYPGPPPQPPFFLGYPAGFEEYSCGVGFLIYRQYVGQEHNAVSMASGILRGGWPFSERDGEGLAFCEETLTIRLRISNIR